MSNSYPRVTPRWPGAGGQPAPPGCSYLAEIDAYNFALYSTYATSVTLDFYRHEDPATPVHTVVLDPRINKSGRVWHCQIPARDLNGAELYGYRVAGPYEPARGHRFDPEKVLLDPYAKRVFFPDAFSRSACSSPGPTAGKAPLAWLPQRTGGIRQAEWGGAEWGGAEPPRPPPPRHGHDTIVYEMHVRGFTMRPNSGVSPASRGTFRGVIEKIPYLEDLGVTVVELLPVQQYDPGEGNYFGYMPLNFFAPHAAYAREDPAWEFREMVDALHEAGIEVWIDVVYNHTSEAQAGGPTYCFRGLDNKTYYLLDPATGDYQDHTGCGNTVRTAHPAVRALVVESVRYWAEELGVDGFRFDLASVFARDLRGQIDQRDPAIIAELSSLGYRDDLVMVAEAWDLSAYQLGRGFPGFSWRQWNGRFRDDVRRFVRGDPGMIPDLMRRLYGSDDLFPDTPLEAYRPFQSVNFVTCHDGFCLYDLVSYNQKHNEANGHGNTDGADENFSWNCGHEGDEDVPPEVVALRRRQAKNFFCLLMLAAGTPQFLAGDEFLHTQQGNNNPYNQDNDTTWLNWDLLQHNQDIYRFVRLLISFRKSHPSLGRNRFWREDVRWFGLTGEPDLSPSSHSLAFFLSGAALVDDDIYVLINASEEDREFAVQIGGPRDWLKVVDTARPSPADIAEPGSEERLVSGEPALVRARSVIVLRRASRSLESRGAT